MWETGLLSRLFGLQRSVLDTDWSLELLTRCNKPTSEICVFLSPWVPKLLRGLQAAFLKVHTTALPTYSFSLYNKVIIVICHSKELFGKESLFYQVS